MNELIPNLVRTHFAANILNTRSQKFNLLQHALGICAPERGVYDIVNKLCVTVPHNSVHEKLKDASTNGKRRVESRKSNVEKNQSVSTARVKL